jgi:hypothetical protein
VLKGLSVLNVLNGLSVMNVLSVLNVLNVLNWISRKVIDTRWWKEGQLSESNFESITERDERIHHTCLIWSAARLPDKLSSSPETLP